MLGFPNEHPNDRRADEPRPARDENGLHDVQRLSTLRSQTKLADRRMKPCYAAGGPNSSSISAASSRAYRTYT